MLINLLASLALMSLVGKYIRSYFRRVLKFYKPYQNDNKTQKIAASLAGIMVLPMLNSTGIWPIMLLFFSGFGLLSNSFNKRVMRGNRHPLWDKMYGCGALPFLCTTGMFVYGYKNMDKVVEKHYTVKTNKKLSQKYRVAMISDLHYGRMINDEKLMKCIKSINEAKPDFVVLCGDIVDENTTLDQGKRGFKLLSGLSSKYGTFFVYGNHDVNKSEAKRFIGAKQLKKMLNENGILSLNDEIGVINDELYVIGRRDRSYVKKEGRATPEKLMSYVPENSFSLILDHQPREYKKDRLAGCDLVLSGHTHNGQIWPAGLITRAIRLYDLEYGYKKFGAMQAIVSSGMSVWGYHFRTAGHSEYVIVDIESKQNK